jgi:AcrR family transcriptional regulator
LRLPLLTGKLNDMPTTSSHERLVTAAARLFYDRGITSTGVDAVVQAAGLTKPTLYAHFPSKSALVVTVLQQRHERLANELEAWVEGIEDAHARPLGVFSWLADWYSRGGQRGCGFLNAAAELADPEDAARPVVRAEKRWLRDLLTSLCEGAGLSQPSRLGSQLLLLVDGVAGRVVVQGSDAAAEAVDDATRVAALLIDAAGPSA